MTQRRRTVLSLVGLVVLLSLFGATGLAAADSVGQTNVDTTAPDCSEVSYEGQGTELRPYEVETVDQLQCLGQNPDANYVQIADINASGTVEWNSGQGFAPIEQEFTGEFDGGEYEIRGLTIERPTDFNVGLFSRTGSTAVIINVSLVQATVVGDANVGGLIGENAGTVRWSSTAGFVTGNGTVGGLIGTNTDRVTVSHSTARVTGEEVVGGLAGSNEGTVNGSYATGDVGGVSRDGSSRQVGGLVGFNGGTINGSYATGVVNASRQTGGLVGHNYDNGEINESYATGAVNASEQVGGLVGESSGGTIRKSYATGDVTGETNIGGLLGQDVDRFDVTTVTNSYAVGRVNGDEAIGGLVGSATERLNIIQSYTTGRVSGTEYIGGLIGEGESGAELTVEQSYATGIVTGDKFVGGLAGIIQDVQATITNSYASGRVVGDQHVGGLVAENEGTVTQSYATGRVSGDRFVGGLVGNNDGEVTRSYATGRVTGFSEVGGLVGQQTGDATVSKSYWDLNSTGQSESAGDAVGRTTAQMTGSLAETAMSDLNFTTTWQTAPNDYPRLAAFDTGLTGPYCPDTSYPGLGTAQRPYEVRSLAQLQCMNQDLTASYELTTDIDATETAAWSNNSGFAPVGNESASDSAAFAGQFDGNGYTISNLSVDRENQPAIGLFGVIAQEGEVENLRLTNATVSGDDTVGSIAGENRGTVDRVSVSGTVGGAETVGGVVGANPGTVNRSAATSRVTGDGIVGGLVGNNELGGTVRQSYSAGEVTASNRVGGLVGESPGTVTRSYWDTNATGQATSEGGTGLTTAQMTGINSRTNMSLGFGTAWRPVSGEYPALLVLNTTVPPIVGDTAALDPDQDGLYERVRGGDSFTILDVQALFNNLDNPDVQNNAERFKFQESSGSDEVTILDVQALFNELQE